LMRCLVVVARWGPAREFCVNKVLTFALNSI
jgi:hypothetical protein